MNETTKAAPRRARLPLFQRAFTGRGIDIGGGGDPLHAGLGFPGIIECESFDREQGNAYLIHQLRPVDSYDFVYSSQTLEDMDNPSLALQRWSLLVKPGGFLVVTVPDFELYERGRWPSIGNGAHQTAWSLGDARLAPHLNLLEFLADFLSRQVNRGWRLMLLQLADTHYDYRRCDTDQTLGPAEAFLEFVLWRRGPLPLRDETMDSIAEAAQQASW